jgi:hypothetical protein
VAVGPRGVDFLEFIRGESSQYSSHIVHDRFPSAQCAQWLEVQG